MFWYFIFKERLCLTERFSREFFTLFSLFVAGSVLAPTAMSEKLQERKQTLRRSTRDASAAASMRIAQAAIPPSNKTWVPEKAAISKENKGPCDHCVVLTAENDKLRGSENQRN